MNKNRVRRPLDYPLPWNVEVVPGVLHVKLATLHQLRECWYAHRHRYRYAASGIAWSTGNDFMEDTEWFFGMDRVNLIKAVFRWEQLGVHVRFVDFAAGDDPEADFFFRDQAVYWAALMKERALTEEEERERVSYLPEQYRGYWTLAQVPMDLDTYYLNDVELTDPAMPVPEVETVLLTQYFESSRAAGDGEVAFHSAEDMEEEIGYWEQEREAGQDYCGRENEGSSAAAAPVGA